MHYDHKTPKESKEQNKLDRVILAATSQGFDSTKESVGANDEIFKPKLFEVEEGEYKSTATTQVTRTPLESGVIF